MFLNRQIGFTRQQIDLVDRFLEREGGAYPVMLDNGRYAHYLEGIASITTITPTLIFIATPGILGLYVEVIQEAVATDGGQVTRAEVRGRPHHAPRAQGRHRHSPPRRYGRARVAASHGHEAPAHPVAPLEALAAEPHKLVRRPPPSVRFAPLTPPAQQVNRLQALADKRTASPARLCRRRRCFLASQRLD